MGGNWLAKQKINRLTLQGFCYDKTIDIHKNMVHTNSRGVPTQFNFSELAYGFTFYYA